MPAEPIRDDDVDAMRLALIETDLVIERRLGEARVDAQEVIDVLAELGWRLERKT